LAIKIAVASGKGGTGKTTVVTNLALAIGDTKKVVVGDCDVEEPNSHIFIGADMKKVKDVSLLVPRIDENLCDLCGECVKACEYHALALIGDRVMFFEELCSGCGGCALVCPQRAITEVERPIGTVRRGVSDKKPLADPQKGGAGGVVLIDGVLNVGEARATPVIKEVKRTAEKEGRDVIIYDAPPGTSCPVIETLSGADFVLLVTEPTPFGLHDLKLAVDVVKKMGLRFGVVINKDGLGYGGLEEYLSEEKIPVLLRIPHSEKTASMYSMGTALVETDEKWKKEFAGLYEKTVALSNAGDGMKREVV